MAYNPPRRNVAFAMRVSLDSYTSPGRAQVAPTLAAGDVKIDKDGAGLNNLAWVALPDGDRSLHTRGRKRKRWP